MDAALILSTIKTDPTNGSGTGAKDYANAQNWSQCAARVNTINNAQFATVYVKEADVVRAVAASQGSPNNKASLTSGVAALASWKSVAAALAAQGTPDTVFNWLLTQMVVDGPGVNVGEPRIRAYLSSVASAGGDSTHVKNSDMNPVLALAAADTCSARQCQDVWLPGYLGT